MPLPINGYNETFKAFADFAAKSVDAGRSKAIARASADASTGALAGRSISPAGSDSVRHVFNWFRASDEKTAEVASDVLTDLGDIAERDLADAAEARDAARAAANGAKGD